MTYCLMKVEMEDESDIYSDLPLYNFDVELEKLKSSNKNLCVEIANLQEELQKVTKEKDEYQTRCATLTKNISSLLKTAQAEIQRKDKLIKELRDQITEINLETRGYRKRKIQKDSVPAEAPATKRSANGIIEDSNRRKDGFSSAYRENSSTVNEKKPVSSSNDRSKQDASAVNTEIGLLRPTTQRLPFANVQCKTLYSQRMLDKMQTPSTTNQSTDVQPKSISDKETNDNEKIAQRNGVYESAGVKETAIDKVKGNEDKKFVDNCMKSDAANASPFLVPEVNGIMKISADKRQSEANPEPKKG
ncbi:hypothetical protein O3M35_011900 [Rhynocoris fuscipes]|uniref:Uncharacterized protein n=1 Tax=Rhynocoris fuscipes TaxID=488301 RepID=A0AAW1CXC2_9HEMI